MKSPITRHILVEFQSTGNKMSILKLLERRKETKQVISKDGGQTSAEEILSDTGNLRTGRSTFNVSGKYF